MTFLKIHPADDVLVALADHRRGGVAEHAGISVALRDDVAAKHKVVVRDIAAGECIVMYGIVVAQARHALRAGELLTTSNAVHATGERLASAQARAWQAPDATRWRNRTFDGFVRDDGRVGTRNHWVVVPLVFCENRNLQVMREAMIDELGYGASSGYRRYARRLADMISQGKSTAELIETSIDVEEAGRGAAQRKIFPHVDGLKFLFHHGGCGGSNNDSHMLSRLLAGYIVHPNVAGATVLSLGCQKAQIIDLQNEIHRRNPRFQRPLLLLEQQRIGSEKQLLERAISQTMAGLVDADKARREAVPLAQLVVGLECGGSDGFSGISANPAMGYCSDLVVALGGTALLAEFPELAGCECELTARCVSAQTAERFLKLMGDYERRAQSEGSGFDANPSPGNIRDGLITDAMKSAGAARKGGTSPVVDVLDYPEPVVRNGLNLLCTPGNDVESTTALGGSGANVMLFSTGLGTPTGNPVAPVLKISSNTALARRMPDIIDCDAGPVIDNKATIEQIGETLLEQLIAVASGNVRTKAEMLGQDDFIPWKRDSSL